MINALIFLVSFLLIPSVIMAEPWNRRCENAISKLKNAQQEVSSAHNEYESVKSEYEWTKTNLDLCTRDCENLQYQLRIASAKHNERLSKLKRALSDFESAIGDFKNNCLK